MFKSKLFTPLLLLGLLFSINSQALSMEDSTTSVEDSTQEELEKDLENLGLAGGYAIQCFQERNNQDEVARVGEETLSVAQILLQDFGSTTAFLFSATTGYGAAKSIDLNKCDQIIADWNKFMDIFAESQLSEGEE